MPETTKLPLQVHECRNQSNYVRRPIFRRAEDVRMPGEPTIRALSHSKSTMRSLQLLDRRFCAGGYIQIYIWGKLACHHSVISSVCKISIQTKTFYLQVKDSSGCPNHRGVSTIYRASADVRSSRYVRQFLKWNDQTVPNLASIVIDRMETFDFDNWTPGSGSLQRRRRSQTVGALPKHFEPLHQ